MGFKLSSLAVLCAAALSNMAHAEPQQVDETIVVIGRQAETPLDIAANVTVIDAAQIEQTGVTSLAELLRGRSGIQISDSNTGPTLAMRGFSGSQAANNTLILLDGRRLNNTDIAAANLSAIPLQQIERVEILSGSAGVLYGDQAVGGVINIITKAPQAVGGNLTLGTGSFNRAEGQGDIGGNLSDNWRYYLSGAYNRSDNYRDHNANHTGSVLGRLQYQTDMREFFVEGSYYDNKRQNPGALSEDDLRSNPRKASAFQADDYLHEMTDAWRLHLKQVLGSHWQMVADINYSDTLVSSISYGSHGQNSRSLLEFNPKFVGNYVTDKGDLKWVLGGDVHRGEADFDLSGTDRSNTQTMTSIYAQAIVPLTRTLEYVAGGRYAKVKDELRDAAVYPGGTVLDENAHALALGLNYRPTDAQRWYLRAEQNFRFAKVDEQAYTSPGVFGLKPQTGDSVEAGWDWHPAKQQLGVHLYRLALQDEIVYDTSATKPVGGMFNGANVNADESRRYGADLSWYWQPLSQWQLGSEYHYVDAEFTEGANEGKALSWVAKHSGRLFSSVDVTDNWQLYAEAQYLGSRYMEGDNANEGERIDSYWLGNLAVNYHRNAWLASVRIDNLFDKTYVSSGYYSSWGNGYYVGDGRNVSASISYRF
ncbi:TonB-dependent receptor family protein [Shewanella sp. YIC-542]|uniref:TonB-dependent receptor family protein n=1 Tax=Shewanella mytili TaxID=3377111 RepID=UPI00398EEC4C